MKVTIPKSQLDNVIKLLSDFEEDLTKREDISKRIYPQYTRTGKMEKLKRFYSDKGIEYHRRIDSPYSKTFLAPAEIYNVIANWKDYSISVSQGEIPYSRFAIHVDITEKGNKEIMTEYIEADIKLSKKLNGDTFWNHFRKHIEL